MNSVSRLNKNNYKFLVFLYFKFDLPVKLI